MKSDRYECVCSVVIKMVGMLTYNAQRVESSFPTQDEYWCNTQIIIKK